MWLNLMGFVKRVKQWWVSYSYSFESTLETEVRGSRALWLGDKDKNTKSFHCKANSNRRNNIVEC
jgi:hypothetical protein